MTAKDERRRGDVVQRRRSLTAMFMFCQATMLPREQLRQSGSLLPLPSCAGGAGSHQWRADGASHIAFRPFKHQKSKEGSSTF